MRFVDVVFAAVLAVAFVACEPPPPCPECPPPVAPRDAGPRDAGQPLPPAPRDGGHEWPDATVEECSEEEREAWAGFFRRLDFVEQHALCVAEPDCDATTCTASECIADRHRLPACSMATRLECLSRRCRDSCGAWQSAEGCRFCACSAGCLRELGVCSQCDARTRTCAPHAMRPELVWLVGR